MRLSEIVSNYRLDRSAKELGLNSFQMAQDYRLTLFNHLYGQILHVFLAFYVAKICDTWNGLNLKLISGIPRNYIGRTSPPKLNGLDSHQRRVSGK